MNNLIHDLILHSAQRTPDADCLRYRKNTLSYGEIADTLKTLARGYQTLGLARGDRVGVYLEKCPETVCSLFAASMADGIFVPINPLLKAEQVQHILQDCNIRILVTSESRLRALDSVMEQCHDLHSVVLASTVKNAEAFVDIPQTIVTWKQLNTANHGTPFRSAGIDTDVAAILYTSGSTGKPKGVVLSHRNLIAGAESVASYLHNRADDCLLAALPLSFDYGLSQLTTAFLCGANVVLMNYLLPRDVIRSVEKEKITGLAAVPPLWNQLAQLEWPEGIDEHLRYLTNSGGAMPRNTLNALRRALPKTQVYLMYGLTEAFRSSYLDPQEIDRRPDSMGKAIPNAEILVLREDGSPCAPGEPGELIHRGAHVALGYWNDPERTRERFRPLPPQVCGHPNTELAVWSGDTVRTDQDGFLYFVSRKDDMIKTSGYRVSPTEVEEVLYASGQIGEAAIIGIPHSSLGQAIIAVITSRQDRAPDTEALLATCKQHLPNFMLPTQLVIRDTLPRNQNGKIDRKSLAQEYARLFNDNERDNKT
jgi:acyl-CoA ligase (AMP-forming) (exosortase A-associated)